MLHQMRGCAQLSCRCAGPLGWAESRPPTDSLAQPIQWGACSVVTLRATATFPSRLFIGTAAHALQQLDIAKQSSRADDRSRGSRASLADARNTIHDLETKLGHERLARDEVTQRINAERLQIEEALTAMQEELATERALRARAERERDEAIVATQTVEQRQKTTVKAAQPPPAPFPSDQPRRRRGRPPKVARQEVAPDDSDIVEWWSPGWQEKYR